MLLCVKCHSKAHNRPRLPRSPKPVLNLGEVRRRAAETFSENLKISKSELLIMKNSQLFNIVVKPSTHRRLKILSAFEGLKLNWVVEQALTAWLAKHEANVAKNAPRAGVRTADLNKKGA